ncbi:hypothetical protein DPMN_078554 [Dreissena polymorpha]|uniref:Uncharacterized protein n=1 Tax=Dreissena polymorpha TaxID=45954 RepID=A0A9D4BQL2_DREPO|nr:hypothetical protein DPMN_078554 [Dreissena polymorpha]
MEIQSICVGVGTGGREAAQKHFLSRPGCSYRANVKAWGQVEERLPRNTFCRDLDGDTKHMCRRGDRWKGGGLETFSVETWMQLPSKCESVGSGGREAA